VIDVLAQATIEWQCRMDTRTAKDAASAIATLASAGARDATNFIEACESPIERQFALGFFLVEGWTAVPFGKKSIKITSPNPELSIVVVPQSEWSDAKGVVIWRVDFALQVECAEGVFYKLAVEIDGHEWHERTKDQVRRDRERERALLSSTGLNALIRFSGSEVFGDPAGAVVEAINVVVSQSGVWRYLATRYQRPTGGAT
jgi:hypothetical protein